MEGTTIIFPDAYIDECGSENILVIDFNNSMIEIEIDFKLIQLTRVQLAGLLKMMEEYGKV